MTGKSPNNPGKLPPSQHNWGRIYLLVAVSAVVIVVLLYTFSRYFSS